MTLNLHAYLGPSGGSEMAYLLNLNKKNPMIGKVIPLPTSRLMSEVAQSCLTLCDPMDCSLLGSSIHGTFQARVPEWGAIAFSKWNITWLLKKRNIAICSNMDGSRSYHTK